MIVLSDMIGVDMRRVVTNMVLNSLVLEEEEVA